jgi:CBS domain-containing protein
VREALAVLAKEPTGAVAVIEDGRAIGIFTERDVLKRVAQLPERLALPVTEVMTPDPVILRESDTIATALNKMGSGGFRHMPLASAEGLVGIVTARDVLNWVMANYFD